LHQSRLIILWVYRQHFFVPERAFFDNKPIINMDINI